MSSATVAGQKDPGIYLSIHLFVLIPLGRLQMCTTETGFSLVGSGNPNSSPYTCRVCILSTEPSPKPQFGLNFLLPFLFKFPGRIQLLRVLSLELPGTGSRQGLERLALQMNTMLTFSLSPISRGLLIVCKLSESCILLALFSYITCMRKLSISKNKETMNV